MNFEVASPFSYWETASIRGSQPRGQRRCGTCCRGGKEIFCVPILLLNFQAFQLRWTL